MRVPITRLRNIGIMAHIDAGKTTVTEQVLHKTGRIRVVGLVHEGTAHTDHLPEEQRRGITIQSAATSCSWTLEGQEYTVNLIDTPGHVDFTIEVERALRVLDGAVAVLCAVAGVEAQTETVWRQADRHGVARVALINKMDRPGADPVAVMGQMRERLGCDPVPVQAWLGAGDRFTGVLELLGGRVLEWPEGVLTEREPTPEERELLDARREALVERLAELDEPLMNSWLQGYDSVGDSEVWSALRRLTVAGRIVPVAFASALKSAGVEPLLDLVARALPSPLDAGSIEGVDGQVRAPSEDEPLSGLVFKVVVDKYAGALAWIRVYSGTLRVGDRVTLSDDGRRVKVRGLMKMDAGAREPVAEAGPGEIVAVTGLGRVVSSETLHDPEAPIALAAIERPEPVVWLGVSPESDPERFADAMGRILTEDPSLAHRVDEETGQTLLGGVGELHLEVTLGRLRDEFEVDVLAGAPQVAYRVTAGREVEHNLRFKRQNGGPGAFADVTLRVTPGRPGQGVRFVSQVTGQVLPREFQAAVAAGVEDGAERGILGEPIEDVDVALVGGAFHENDSSDRDFRSCASKALVEAVEASAPRRLEPMMRLEVVTTEESLGLVIGDLSKRRGRVLGMEHRDRAVVVVNARVPLAELFGYAGTLRGLSGGRGSYTASPDGRELI